MKLLRGQQLAPLRLSLVDLFRLYRVRHRKFPFYSYLLDAPPSLRSQGLQVACEDFDLDQSIFGERSDGSGRASRGNDSLGRELPLVDRVHGGQVSHIFEEDRGFDYGSKVQTSLRQHSLDVLEDADGLLFSAAGDELLPWPGRGLPARRRAGVPHALDCLGSRDRLLPAGAWWRSRRFSFRS